VKNKITQRPFGNVRRLPSGRFQARWQDPSDGHTHTAPGTFPTRDDAKLWLAGQRVDRAEGTWIDERISGQAFAVVADKWKAGLAGRRDSTRARDLGYFERYIAPRWSAVALDEIEPGDVADWYAQLSAGDPRARVAPGARDICQTYDPLAPATVGKAGQIFRKILELAVARRMLSSNPAEGIALPGNPEPFEMMVIDPFELDALAAAAPSAPKVRRGEYVWTPARWSAFVRTGCYCGLRVGELLALRAGDIDLERRIIHVRRTVVEVAGRRIVNQPKTKAGLRSVPFPRALKAELEGILEAVEHPGDLVFPNSQGDYVGLSSFRSRIWNPATERAGLAGFRIHDMRHTAISLWIAAGKDPKTIAAWAGHRSVVTVLDRYGHLYDHGPDPMGELDHMLEAARPRRRLATVTELRP
jgi:integrase